DPVPLTSETLQANRSVAFPGQPVSFTSTTGGGSSPYRTDWTIGIHFQGPTSPDWNWTPTTPGNYTMFATGVDAKLETLDSPTLRVSVPYPLGVSAITVTPKITTADDGQSVAFSAKSFGGFGKISFLWSGLPAGCTGANTSKVACTLTGNGSTNVSVGVNDSTGTTVTSAPVPFTAYADPAVELSSNATVLDLGQSFRVSASSSGGAGGNVFNWSGVPPGCAATLPTFVCTPSTTGNFYLQLSVTDRDSGWALSRLVAVIVSPDPVLTLTLSRSGVDPGVPVFLNASALHGSGNLTVNWSGLPGGCTGTIQLRLLCLPPSPGWFNISASATDAAGFKVTHAALTLHVFTAISVALTASPVNSTYGDTVTFVATITGGSGSPTVVWLNMPPGCGVNNQSTSSCIPGTTGTFEAGVYVSDAGGGHSEVNVTVTISYAPQGGSGVSGNGSLFIVVLGVGALAAAGVVLFLRRRRAAPPADAGEST
ncbi:MAG: hypothetical protein L3K09_05065, partial [Thermoplasmata archaeon]|nr:hypothetical protein [Thermoplasmata archaeon]